jgi:hypothetical protein
MDGKPGATSVFMTPPLLLHTGYAIVLVYIIAPGFRGETVFIRAGTFILTAIPEFISVSFSAYGTCDG